MVSRLFVGNNNFNRHGSLLYHKELVQLANKKNINHREWIDSMLRAG